MGTFIFSSPLPLAIPVAIFVLFIVSIVIDFMTLLQKLHTHENKSKKNILQADLRSENKCYFMKLCVGKEIWRIAVTDLRGHAYGAKFSQFHALFRKI